MTDFFTLEAGEYLERLDGALAGGTTPPPVDEMLKLSRALRGSALMANKGLIARAAAGLEALVRAVREGRRNWDAETQQITIRAVDDLKILIRSVLNWTDADSVKAEALSGELERLAGLDLKPDKVWKPPPILQHGDLRFALLVCSELTNISHRAALRRLSAASRRAFAFRAPARQPNRSPVGGIAAAGSAPSSRSSASLVGRPPPKPVSLPSLPITRWQGSTIGSGLRPLAAPTARTAAGWPMAFASWP